MTPGENISVEDVLLDPDYDQGLLQQWFQHRYGDAWKFAWDRYLETGIIPGG